VKEKRRGALGFVTVPVPTAENEPNVAPVTVGDGVGSVSPVEGVTAAKLYFAVNDCAPKNKLEVTKVVVSNFFIIILSFKFKQK
jgi:hypothetical protein